MLLCHNVLFLQGKTLWIVNFNFKFSAATIPTSSAHDKNGMNGFTPVLM